MKFLEKYDRGRLFLEKLGVESNEKYPTVPAVYDNAELGGWLKQNNKVKDEFQKSVMLSVNANDAWKIIESYFDNFYDKGCFGLRQIGLNIVFNNSFDRRLIMDKITNKCDPLRVKEGEVLSIGYNVINENRLITALGLTGKITEVTHETQSYEDFILGVENSTLVIMTDMEKSRTVGEVRILQRAVDIIEKNYIPTFCMFYERVSNVDKFIVNELRELVDKNILITVKGINPLSKKHPYPSMETEEDFGVME